MFLTSLFGPRPMPTCTPTSDPDAVVVEVTADDLPVLRHLTFEEIAFSATPRGLSLRGADWSDDAEPCTLHRADTGWCLKGSYGSVQALLHSARVRLDLKARLSGRA